MTFQEYISNPTGIGTAVMSYRKMYEDLYQNKWSLILTRENGKIDYSLWRDKDNACYCYIKVPSEVVPDFYYDVVVKMKVNKNSMNLSDSEVQFFSNDPNFSYVFAYAFKKHNMTIPELEFKMSKDALTKKPVQKNPQLIINYVKSLYFAYIVMRNKGLFQRARYMDAPQFDKKKFEKLIQNTDDKIYDRQIKGEEIQKENRRKANKGKTSSTPTSTTDNHNIKLVSNAKSNNITKTKNIGTVGNKFPVNKTVKNNIKTVGRRK